MNVGDDGKIGLSIRRAIDKPESEKTTTTSSYSSRKPRAAVKKPTFDKPEDFESKMSRFLKDSDERLTTIKRQSESKRGGRGARRS